MRKRPFRTGWLTWLVLLPVGLLAWLAMQAADAFEAAEDAQVRATVARGMEAARAAMSRELAALQDEFDTALAESAAYVRERVPIDGIGPAMEAARKRIWHVGLKPTGGSGARAGWRGDLKLIDARGRTLDPAEYVPHDGIPEPRTALSSEALFDAIARKADAALYGEGNLDAALAVWDQARQKLGSQQHKARCDVERARLEIRAAERRAAYQLAKQRAVQIEDDHGLSVLTQVGRPAVLLWLASGRFKHLQALLGDGRLDRIPLTKEERAQVIDVCQGQARGQSINHPLYMRVWPHTSYNGARPVYATADVAEGARIEMWVHQVWIWNALFHRMRDAWDDPELEIGVSARHTIPFSDGTLPSYEQRIYSGNAFVEGPAGSQGVFGVAYKGWPEIVQGRRGRRVLIFVVIGALLLTTLGGVFFFRRAVKRERAARRLRDDFIANVTHEVRTPLTSVLMHAEMLADDDLAADRKQTYARVVHAEGARLARLVEDMLDFTALERGTRSLDVVPLDLNAAAQHAVEPFRVLAEREGVALDVDAPEGELAASGDAGAVSRVLANLMGNAWKHGRPSRDGAPGRIRIRVGEAEGMPYVEIRDDGPGIAAADRERVFERFGRGRASDGKEGAGLGLALSRDLARAMGGDLTVHQEGNETVFRLRLRAGSVTMEGGA